MRRPSDTEVAALIRQGDALAAELGRKRKNGIPVPVQLPETAFGQWQYVPVCGGAEFELVVGNYKEFMFVLHWSSKTGAWVVDR